MSRQMRINDETYRDLREMAKQVGYRPTDFASAMVQLFKQLFEELQDDGRLMIDKPSSGSIRFGFPFKLPRELPEKKELDISDHEKIGRN